MNEIAIYERRNDRTEVVCEGVVDQWYPSVNADDDASGFGFVKYRDTFYVFFRCSDILPDESGAIPAYKVAGTRVRFKCPVWLLSEVV